MRYKCATSHLTHPAQFVATLLLLASVRIRGSFDGQDCDDEDEGSGSGEEEREWWYENITNGTELCSGVMDFNTSGLINSWLQNASSGNSE